MDERFTGYEDVNWVKGAQDRTQWRAFVKTVMELLVS
jgi:hypothetical protein